jgi:acetyl esterase/lipase
MFSPFADLRGRGDTVKTLAAVDPLLPTVASGDNVLASLIGVYLGNNASLLDDPLASPTDADYVSLFPGGSLPPVLIQVGLRELLLSDSVRLYHKMKAAAPASGHVVVSPYEGMWHVWQQFVDLPEAEAAAREMADFFTRALKGEICK